ncbi:MAG: hypothetical protein FJX75_01220 [Armatimonadetes bacterium]|nr:hypothetical protein [Armatimonadota bacterium]
MRTSVKVFAAVGILVICALAAAELLHRVKSNSRPRTRADAVAPPVQADAAPAPEEASAAESSADYARVAQRDLFRPLVRAPKAAEGGSGEGTPKAGAQKPNPGPSGPGPTGGPPKPADPLADLALTGVVQVGGRLQVLIEKLSTRTGRYVALHEEFEGFRVVLIGENSAVLDRGGKQFTLLMGSKQLPDQAAAAPAGGAAATGPTVASGASPGGSDRPGGGGRGGEMGGAFSGDMLAWAEGRPLAELEGMYAQYGAYLSPEDRARAQEYLESRRRRERGQ